MALLYSWQASGDRCWIWKSLRCRWRRRLQTYGYNQLAIIVGSGTFSYHLVVVGLLLVVATSSKQSLRPHCFRRDWEVKFGRINHWCHRIFDLTSLFQDGDHLRIVLPSGEWHTAPMMHAAASVNTVMLSSVTCRSVYPLNEANHHPLNSIPPPLLFPLFSIPFLYSFPSSFFLLPFLPLPFPFPL